MDPFEERLRRLKQTDFHPVARRPLKRPPPSAGKVFALISALALTVAGSVGGYLWIMSQSTSDVAAAAPSTAPILQPTPAQTQTTAKPEADLSEQQAELALASDEGIAETVSNAAEKGPTQDAADPAASDPETLEQVTHSSTDGWLYRHPAAAVLANTGDTTRGDAQTIVAQYRDPHQAPGFRSVDLIEPQETCRYRPIRQGEKPYLVLMETAFPNAPALSLQRTAMAERIERMAEEVLDPNRRNFTMGEYTAVGQVAWANLYVTDTSAPLYLVLGMGRAVVTPPAVIWNIHLAPGVKLAHLTLTGPQGLGVVLPPEVEVPMTVASTGLTADPSTCLPQIARKPDDGWENLRYLQRNPDKEMARRNVEQGNDAHQRYRLALEALTGLSPEVAALSPYAADHLLLGPLPDQPLAFQWPAEHHLRITRADHLEFGPRDFIARRVLEVHADVVASAIGPDWSAALAPQKEIAR